MDKDHWTDIISNKKKWLDLNLRELWDYRDLLVMLVKRDFVASYKQTILGPIWFFLQPVLTTIIYVVVFTYFAGLSTDGLPAILFYLSGVTLWNYFSECLNKTATVFKDNSNIFGKVYFPRLIMPLSIVVSNLVKFGIQFLMFLLFLLYYINHNSVHPNITILLTPLLILMMAGISLGLGMIVSALTTRYRDLIFLLTFGIQLFMYATPIIYPLSSVPEKYRFILNANPMTSIVETFRYAFLGSGTFSGYALGYSFAFMIVIISLGAIVFNRVEKTFMDTV